MEWKGNKGEWSELYAFLRLLGDGCIYCGDEALNRRLDRAYPILKIFRTDKPDRKAYSVQPDRESIEVRGDEQVEEYAQRTFTIQADRLLELIKEIKTADFTEITPFLEAIGVDSIKAKSTDKTDIRLVIHDIRTGACPELGYSIKSRLGAPSTLINANVDKTNFLYRVSTLSDDEIIHCNSLRNFKEKFAYLDQLGAHVEFVQTCSQPLKVNLMMLDLGMEQIIGQLLLSYYRGCSGRSIEKLTLDLVQQNPLGLEAVSQQPIYQYKVKQFLLAFALGMTCSKPWSGRFNANGGYIVVKEDGDIVCYHFFERNDLEEYLFCNTQFDTPSTTRHQFGKILRANGECFLKLNLQVRFV